MAKIPHSLWRARLCASVLIALVGTTKAQSPTPSGTVAGKEEAKMVELPPAKTTEPWQITVGAPAG